MIGHSVPFPKLAHCLLLKIWVKITKILEGGGGGV